MALLIPGGLKGQVGGGWMHQARRSGHYISGLNVASQWSVLRNSTLGFMKRLKLLAATFEPADAIGKGGIVPESVRKPSRRLLQFCTQPVSLDGDVGVHVDKLGHVFPVATQLILKHAAFFFKETSVLLEHFLAGELIGPFGLW
ncbi:MAG: hypothetical protein ACRER8_12380 [Pseudomonas sp.]|uniref:hypothetical protein n=1 Tax=Pseudomonas sp. TaxID=306 RepID=UPI003D6F0BAA